MTPDIPLTEDAYIYPEGAVVVRACTIKPEIVILSVLLVPVTATFKVRVESVSPPIGIVIDVMFLPVIYVLEIEAPVQKCHPAGAFKVMTSVPGAKSLLAPSLIIMEPSVVQLGEEPVTAEVAQILVPLVGAVITTILNAGVKKHTPKTMKQKDLKKYMRTWCLKNSQT